MPAAPTLLDEALSYIRRKRADLVVQFDETEGQLQHLSDHRYTLMKQIHWLDEQHRELVAQAAAEQTRHERRRS